METSTWQATSIDGSFWTHPGSTIAPLDSIRYEVASGLSLDTAPVLWMARPMFAPCPGRAAHYSILSQQLDCKNVAAPAQELEALANAIGNIFPFFITRVSTTRKKITKMSSLKI